jgi:hypothetical protein
MAADGGEDVQPDPRPPRPNLVARHWRKAAIAIATLVVAPVTANVISDRIGESNDDKAAKSHLALGDVQFTTSEPQPGLLLPRIELALNNVGSATSVLQHVGFEVREVARIKTCYTAGELGVVQAYGVAIPASAKAGDLIKSPALRRSLAPNEAERLAFDLGVEGAAEGESLAFSADVGLWHDNQSEPIGLGRIAVVVPAGGLSVLQVFSETQSHETIAGDVSAARCLLANTLGLHNVLSSAEQGPPELLDFKRQLLAPAEARALAKQYGVTS